MPIDLDPNWIIPILVAVITTAGAIIAAMISARATARDKGQEKKSTDENMKEPSVRKPKQDPKDYTGDYFTGPPISPPPPHPLKYIIQTRNGEEFKHDNLQIGYNGINATKGSFYVGNRPGMGYGAGIIDQKGIPLSSGRIIAFDHIKRVEFSKVEKGTDAVITLLDNSIVRGSIVRCDTIESQTPFGPFSRSVDNVTSITIEHMGRVSSQVPTVPPAGRMATVQLTNGEKLKISAFWLQFNHYISLPLPAGSGCTFAIYDDDLPTREGVVLRIDALKEIELLHKNPPSRNTIPIRVTALKGEIDVFDMQDARDDNCSAWHVRGKMALGELYITALAVTKITFDS